MVTVGDKRILVQADSDHPKIVRHLVGDYVFYGGPQVSITESDGFLGAGNELTIESATWFVSAGQSNLQESPAPGGQQLIAERLAALEAK